LLSAIVELMCGPGDVVTKQIVLGLGRHAATEAIGTGQSSGTQFLFSSLEKGLKRHFTVVRVPPEFYWADGKTSLRMAIDLLGEVDACIFGLPPDPFDLDPFFLVRARLKKWTPFVYMPLGEFPRGAWCYRNVCQHLRRQDTVLFSSRSDRAIHDALVTSTPARVAVVPYGIHPERFRIPASVRSTTRSRMGIAPDEIVFVYHGRVTAEKNICDAITMFRRIARDHPATCFWVVGRVEERPPDFGAPPASNSLSGALRALLQEDLLAQRVRFWGGLAPEAVPRLLAAADVAVNLTLNGDENFGYGVVESMAAGLPIIGTDWGGLKDTIEHGVTGFLVPTVVTPLGVGVDHWRAWQGARALVENTEMRRRMGAAARTRVARVFSVERFAAAVAELVRAQISTRCGRHNACHTWSALGKRLSEMYSTPMAGNPSRVLPDTVPATLTLFADHPLMRKLLKPYATTSQRVGRVPDAVFFLVTELLDLRGYTLHSNDPRYVFCTKLVHAVDRAVVATLAKRGFCDRSSLKRQLQPRFDGESIDASLRRLLCAGIALQSAALAVDVPATGGRAPADRTGLSVPEHSPCPVSP
jgi:glycosyltransferase involved in cell wall biosynthesis